jgi:hypothetical protein
VGKKSKRKRNVDWELMEDMWPEEDRPKKLRSRKFVESITIDQFFKYKEHYEKEAERKGLGSAVFGKDKKPKVKKYKAMKDDGESRLHPARFVGLPRVDPSKYWEKVPTCRQEVYRHLPLRHLGLEGINEQTIVKMHNRKVAIDLNMLVRDSVAEIRHVKEAVLNYVTLLHTLHPVDYAGLAIVRVLNEAGWAERVGSTDKQRVLMLRRFFDDTVRENSGRAVRKEPPLDYEQVEDKMLEL